MNRPRFTVALACSIALIAANASSQLTGEHLNNPILVDVVPIADSYATVVRSSSYVDDRSGGEGQILARPTVHVFGPGPREDSVFQFVPFQTPRRDTAEPITLFTRPALRSGYVYCRLYEAPQFEQVVEEAETRIDSLRSALEGIRDKLKGAPEQDSLVNEADVLEQQLAQETEWLDTIQAPRFVITHSAGDTPEEETDEEDPDEPTDPDDGDEALRASLFRLIIGYIIDGGVYSTDVVCYVHLGERGPFGNTVPVYWIDMALVHGASTDVFKTPGTAGAEDSKLTPETPYVRYWVPYSDPESEPTREEGFPKGFCEADAGIRDVFEEARSTFITATFEAAAPFPTCD